jgi:hypothetical protein
MTRDDVKVLSLVVIAITVVLMFLFGLNITDS